VYSLWPYILGAGLTALLQDRKEILMSKDDKPIEEINYPNFTEEEIELWKKSMPGTSYSDMSVTVDGKELLTNSGSLGSFSTDTITLKEVEFDFQNTDGVDTVTVNVDQGDLFNGWPEDGKPITVNLTEDKK